MTEPTTETREISVLVCEDAELQMNTFKEAVAGTFEGVTISQYGFTAMSVADAVQRATRASVDIVLIDDHLPRAHGQSPEYTGVETAMRIALTHDKKGTRCPRLVLWTRDPSPVRCCGFMLCGDHVLPKEMSVEATRRRLLAVIEGERWKRPPLPDGVSPADTDLIPYIQAGWTTLEIADATGRTEDSVDSARKRLANALGVPAGAGRAVRIPQAATAIGIGWVSLGDRDLLTSLQAEYGLPKRSRPVAR